MGLYYNGSLSRVATQEPVLNFALFVLFRAERCGVMHTIWCIH